MTENLPYDFFYKEHGDEFDRLGSLRATQSTKFGETQVDK